MRIYSSVIAFAAGLLLLASCSDTETYADQKKQERTAIQQFVSQAGITVLSEEEFEAAGEVTDTANNEFVLFDNTGIYMQIVRKGCGEKLADGETATVLCRFSEWNLLTDSLQLSNDVMYYSSIVDKMTVTNTSGTFTGSFISGESVMYTAYGSASVPSGWLVPLSYINLGRPQSYDEEIAKVRLIVPHTQGQSYALANVYPCYYVITYERGR